MGVDAHKKSVAEKDIAKAFMDPDNAITQLVGNLSPKLLERCIADKDYIPIILQLFGSDIKSIISGKLNSLAGAKGADGKGWV